MTRKHYRDLAERFGMDLAAIGNDSEGARAARSGYLSAIAATVTALRSDNPRFDGGRFYDAVTVAEVRFSGVES